MSSFMVIVVNNVTNKIKIQISSSVHWNTQYVRKHMAVHSFQ